MNRTITITYMAVLLTFAVVIHTVESMLPPPLPLPGAKLGLANIITLLALIFYGLKGGLVISLGKSLLTSFFTGTFMGPGLLLSAGAGLTSCVIMALLLPLERREVVSVVSVSVTGAVMHNLTQLFLASVVVGQIFLLQSLFPLYVLIAVPTGIFTGFAVMYLRSITQKSLKSWKVNY